MAEYPTRTCGQCPNLGRYDKVAEQYGDYVKHSTVPQPEVLLKNDVKLDDYQLGTTHTRNSPNLNVPPIDEEKLKQNALKHQKQIEIYEEKRRHQERLAETHQVNTNCCKRDIEEHQIEVECPTSPYSLNQNGNQETPTLKGILKNTQSPARDANVTEPFQQQQQLTPAQVPPRVATALERSPCYLPQPEDLIPETDSKVMGPLDPWATGRLDWGPLAGLTGTRPVVDKYSITRYSEGEWRAHNKTLLDSSTNEMHRSNMVEWNANKCLEQTRAETDKNQSDSTKRLRQREQEVYRWKCELERAIAAAAEEISLMESQRRRLKQAMAVLQLPESIAGECLEKRTGRLDPELVRDIVEEELQHELSLTAELRELFTRTLKDIEHQLLENKTSKQRLEYDWSDKKQTHELDAISVALNNRSTTLLFKPGAVRFPDDQSTRDHWEKFTRETLEESEATRQRSVALRGTLDAILVNASRDLRSQADKVDMALARRIACMEEIRIRLENDLAKILQRLADIEILIKRLQDAIRNMDTPMKKVQTRLDMKLQRPRIENCRDAAHFGLMEEVKILQENVSAVSSQLKQAEDIQAVLLHTRSDLENDIMLKRKTLEIDRDRTQLIRSHYPSATALSGY